MAHYLLCEVMKKILLASQYKTLLQKYSNLLVNWGFKLLTATSGAEALRLHKEHGFDLIVSDYELEGMSLGTLCSLIRQSENDRHVPIIITCHNVPDRLKKARLIGANDIVLKPVDPIKLLEAIGKYVGLNLIRAKRVEIRIGVKIKKEGQELTCFSRDISSTGILVKSDHFFNIGERIACSFTLPGSCTQVEAEGEIVRYMTDSECDNLYGVNFNSISAAHRKGIIDYINSTSLLTSKIKKSENSIHRDIGYAKELILRLPEK